MRPESIHKFEKRGITLPLSMFQPGVMQGNGAGAADAVKQRLAIALAAALVRPLR
jgi:hypothetical protein